MWYRSLDLGEGERGRKREKEGGRRVEEGERRERREFGGKRRREVER